MANTTRFDKEFRCPHCGQLQDALTGISRKEANPLEPGHINFCVCFNCAHINVFENGELRPVTQQELDDCKKRDIRTYIVLKKAQATVALSGWRKEFQ